MLWLALAFPDLGLAVHTRAFPPGTAARPLALVQEGRVLACNAEAAAMGVAPGQRTAGAVALCPPLRFLEHQPAAAARLLRQLAEACIALTPTVVLAPPHNLLLEVGGCLQLFRGQAGLLKQLRRALRPFAVECRLAQAPTPKAALALVASAQAEASLQLTPPFTMTDCLPLLREVPLAALPWPDPLQAKLQALHLHFIGELLALPRAALSKRLGTAATHYLAALLGERPDPQQAITVAEDFQSTLFFLDGISHVEGLRFPMKRQLDELCLFLRQRQWSCARFTWRLAHQDKSRQQLPIASARGEPQAARFMQLTELRLEHLRISAPVEAITLQATEFQPQSDTRLSLLPEPGQEDETALELLDRLRARLGAEACQQLSPVNTRRPEAEQQSGKSAGKPASSALFGRTQEGTPFGRPKEGTPFGRRSGFSPTTVPDSRLGVGMKPDLQADAGADVRKEAWRPFWIWPEPVAVRVIEGRLWWQGAFTLLSRPERIALPWWEEGDTRDYYLARHDNGAHYWLYFSHAAQAWFCQGLFG